MLGKTGLYSPNPGWLLLRALLEFDFRESDVLLNMLVPALSAIGAWKCSHR